MAAVANSFDLIVKAFIVGFIIWLILTIGLIALFGGIAKSLIIFPVFLSLGLLGSGFLW